MLVYALIPFDGFAGQAALPHRAAAADRGRELRADPLRRQAPRLVLATLTAPGLWLQRITTKPPADDQTAVAIHALEGAMALEKSQGGELVIA